MQPFNPDEKKQIMQRNPVVTDTDLSEYEKLLSERFTKDPSIIEAQALPNAEEIKKKTRLKELHQKIFGEQ